MLFFWNRSVRCGWWFFGIVL